MMLGMGVAATLRVVDDSEEVESERRLLAMVDQLTPAAGAGERPMIVRLEGEPPSDVANHLREIYPGACLIW